MTEPETFTTDSKRPLTTDRQWYGPRPPGGGYYEPSAASRENCHADRSHWLGSGEICLRDSWGRCPWQDGRAQDASPSCRISVFANLPACLVRMEASNGAHFWGKALSDLGHDVRLISPQFVAPYVKSNKNDRNDSEAICEAVGRPNMRFVPVKSAEQLAVQAVHRIRSRLVADRVRLVNQVRGLLGSTASWLQTICGALWRGSSATMRTALSILLFAR
jgi:Transposase